MKKSIASLFILVVLSACNLNLFGTSQPINSPYYDQFKGLSVFLVNNCGSNGTETPIWHVSVDAPGTFNDYNIYLKPGQSGQQDLPYSGNYQIEEWTEDGSITKGNIQTVEVPSGKHEIYARALCGGTEAPAKYYLANNCVGTDPTDGHANTVWHWSFQMVSPSTLGGQVIDPVELIIPLGESVSGELPGGMYLVHDWTENGAVNNDTYLATSTQIGYVYVNLCPGNAPLPEAPAQP
jgi:hypothetical protein